MKTADLDEIAWRLGRRLLASGAVIVTAESCTGGLIARALTERSGSSAWFDRGFITYSNNAKIQMLGVSAALLEQHGAVSEPCARAMASGAVQSAGARRLCLAISVTGIAGPTGAVLGKPVGTICFGAALAREGAVLRHEATTRFLSGDRESVRHQAALFALGFVARLLEGESSSADGDSQPTLLA